MFQREWNILLVDDEPDVLSVSKLAMRSFTLYGTPLKIHTAASKAEAVELLKTTLLRLFSAARLWQLLLNRTTRHCNTGRA